MNLKGKRILVANRGEIAVRIITGIHDFGAQALTVFSDVDESSAHRILADDAFRLKGRASSETYLATTKILEAARILKADAIHPGYGFLSENAQFAQSVIDAGLVWIGPSPEAIAKMGDKLTAKALMKAAGVPVVPGSDNPIQSFEEMADLVGKLGLPVMIKAAAGGGGRGMRAVRKLEDLKESFEACRREANSYFGSDSVFCEKLVESGRHIELQIVADRYGECISLFERDCSLQRRQQKIWEEAPSVYLDEKVRKELGELACRAAKASSYEGVGTVEFICKSQNEIYFMEMNTRIQVEHPVTEAITGVDLIIEQLRIASGENLAARKFPPAPLGYAIEVRVNAEDPLENFRPSPGIVERVIWPRGPGVRVDSHIDSGSVVPEEYDSLLGKIIVSGSNREEVLQRLERALASTRIDGPVKTNLDFHRALLNNASVRSGEFHTQFIEENLTKLLSTESLSEISDEDKFLKAMIAAAILTYEKATFESDTPAAIDGDEFSPWELLNKKIGLGLPW